MFMDSLSEADGGAVQKVFLGRFLSKKLAFDKLKHRETMPFCGLAVLLGQPLTGARGGDADGSSLSRG